MASMTTSATAHANAVASTTRRGIRRPTASRTQATTIGTAMATGGTRATPWSNVTTRSALQRHELVGVDRAVPLVHLDGDRQQQRRHRRRYDDVCQGQRLDQRVG